MNNTYKYLNLRVYNFQIQLAFKRENKKPPVFGGYSLTIWLGIMQ
jgi:hypothetical protein